jgi:hypothetical protein
MFSSAVIRTMVHEKRAAKVLDWLKDGLHAAPEFHSQIENPELRRQAGVRNAAELRVTESAFVTAT